MFFFKKKRPYVVVAWSLSHVQLYDSIDDSPLGSMSMGLPRQEYWSGLPFPSPEDHPNLQTEPRSPALAGGFFITEPPGKSWRSYRCPCSVAHSCLTLQPHGLQDASLPCPTPSPRVCSNSSPLSWWCHLTFLFSVILFSPYLQSFPASGSFPVSWLFASGGQSIGASASAPVFPMHIQYWLLLGLIGLIFLQSKGLSRVFFNIIVQKHQLFGAQSSLWSNSHIQMWLLA